MLEQNTLNWIYILKENVLQRKVLVQQVPSIDQVADVLTKVVSSTQFVNLRNKLKVENLSTLSLKTMLRNSFIWLQDVHVSYTHWFSSIIVR